MVQFSDWYGQIRPPGEGRLLYEAPSDYNFTRQTHSLLSLFIPLTPPTTFSLSTLSGYGSPDPAVPCRCHAPPSTTITSPLIKSPVGENKNIVASAMSLTLPKCWSGTFFVMLSRRSARERRAMPSVPDIGPGAMHCGEY